MTNPLAVQGEDKRSMLLAVGLIGTLFTLAGWVGYLEARVGRWLVDKTDRKPVTPMGS